MAIPEGLLVVRRNCLCAVAAWILHYYMEYCSLKGLQNEPYMICMVIPSRYVLLYNNKRLLCRNITFFFVNLLQMNLNV